jgi:hypothetical protein
MKNRGLPPTPKATWPGRRKTSDIPSGANAPA